MGGEGPRLQADRRQRLEKLAGAAMFGFRPARLLPLAGGRRRPIKGCWLISGQVLDSSCWALQECEYQDAGFSNRGLSSGEYTPFFRQPPSLRRYPYSYRYHVYSGPQDVDVPKTRVHPRKSKAPQKPGRVSPGPRGPKCPQDPSLPVTSGNPGLRAMWVPGIPKPPGPGCTKGPGSTRDPRKTWAL